MWRQHKRVPGSVDSWHRLRRPGSCFVSKTKNINPNASKSSENYTNWELAFPIHGKPSHSWVSFQHLFEQFWFPVSGAICVSASSAHQLGPQGSQHLWLKGEKKEKKKTIQGFLYFQDSIGRKDPIWTHPFVLQGEQNWNLGYQRNSSEGNCFLWVNPNSDPSSVCSK